MTIYDQIGKNRWKTVFYIGLFLVFIIGLGWFFAYIYNQPAILIIAIILLGIKGLMSLFA